MSNILVIPLSHKFSPSIHCHKLLAYSLLGTICTNNNATSSSSTVDLMHAFELREKSSRLLSSGKYARVPEFLEPYFPV